jgi:hypothetical protein
MSTMSGERQVDLYETLDALATELPDDKARGLFRRVCVRRVSGVQVDLDLWRALVHAMPYGRRAELRTAVLSLSPKPRVADTVRRWLRLTR